MLSLCLRHGRHFHAVAQHAWTHAPSSHTALDQGKGSPFCSCRAALASTQVLEPRIPVISNVDAQPHSDPDTIKDILARQVWQCHGLLGRLVCLNPNPNILSQPFG